MGIPARLASFPTGRSPKPRSVYPRCGAFFVLDLLAFLKNTGDNTQGSRVSLMTPRKVSLVTPLKNTVVRTS